MIKVKLTFRNHLETYASSWKQKIWEVLKKKNLSLRWLHVSYQYVFLVQMQRSHKCHGFPTFLQLGEKLAHYHRK